MISDKKILDSLPKLLKSSDFKNLGEKTSGKVRDIYLQDGKRILITTDRQSAFDVILGNIPFKGAVLNLLSKFWFEKTKHIVPNHMVSVPDPNVMVVHDCEPILIEMVVRGYLTGVTSTSIWPSYERGERLIYDLKFPDGMKKNQKLPRPIITPTTHGSPSTHKARSGSASGHDERLTRKEILKRKIVSPKIYIEMEKAAFRLFKLGSRVCRRSGLILVDTKYEFGIFKNKLMLMDEIHTPDSSRFWIADTYKERFKNGEEPENFDKEFLRLWYVNKGYTGDGKPPRMSKDLIVALAKRYIGVYEKITGEKFSGFKYPITKRIKKNLREYFLSS